MLDFAEAEPGLNVDWPGTNGACFTVRDDIEYFKVDSNGKIGVPFQRWKAVSPVALSEILKHLNDALHTTWFTDQETATEISRA